MRSQVVEYMCHHSDTYLPAMPHIVTPEHPNGMDWTHHLTHIATDRIWADELPISAAGAMLQMRIRFSWSNPQTNIFEIWRVLPPGHRYNVYIYYIRIYVHIHIYVCISRYRCSQCSVRSAFV